MGKQKKRHWIGWFKFCSAGVTFSSIVDKRMEKEETHIWGYKTACGEVFWPGWQGTTNKNDVTCKKCKKFLNISALICV